MAALGRTRTGEAVMSKTTERRKDGRGTRGLILVLALLSVLPSFHRLCAQAAQPDSFRLKALAILRTVPLIDGHNDIPDAIRERGGLDSVDFAVSQPKLMTDLPRLRAGSVGGQFWAAYVPVTTMDSGPHPAVYALEQIDLVHRLCARYPGSMAMAYTAADVQRNFAAGKFSCLIGIEGGHARRFAESLGGAGAARHVGAGRGPHRAYPAGGGRRPRRDRVGLRRHHRSAERAGGCLEVSRLDRGAAAAWVDRSRRQESRGSEYLAGDAGSGACRRGDAGKHEIGHITRSLR